MRVSDLLLISRASLWDLHHLVPLVGMVEKSLQPGVPSQIPLLTPSSTAMTRLTDAVRPVATRQTVVRVGFIMKVSTSGLALLAVDASHDA